MKRVILLLIVIALQSSCATIFNSKYCKTMVYADSLATIIIDSDTIHLSKKHEVKTILLERSNVKREISVIRDTAIDTIELLPRKSSAYWFNFCSYGLGFIVDATNQKRWQYSESIYISNRFIGKNKPGRIFEDRYSRQGALNLRLSLPYLNWFDFAYEGYGRKSDVGLVGYSLGLDYYYRDKMFINLTGDIVFNLLIPFPAAVDLSGVWNHMHSTHISASNNHKIGKFSVGYGLTFAFDRWNTINHGNLLFHEDEDEDNRESIYRHYQSLGLTLPFYYYTRKSFYMGMTYRPMFMQFADKTRFKYQHTLSIDLGWRIKLKQFSYKSK